MELRFKGHHMSETHGHDQQKRRPQHVQSREMQSSFKQLKYQKDGLGLRLIGQVTA